MITSISCPDCKNLIPINTLELLKGQGFNCTKCFATVSISNESKSQVQMAIEKLYKIKENNVNDKK